MVIIWLITDKGFLSVVAYDPSKDRHNKRSKRQLKSFGPRPVLVRGRREEHLYQLKPYWSKLRIEKDEYADYTYRAVMPRTRWVEFLADAGDKIDYGSHFKEVVRDRCPGSKKAVGEFYSAMMGIWSKLASIQPFAPYGGYGNSFGYSTSGKGTGGGYGSLYTGTGIKPPTTGGAFSSYGGQTFRSGSSASAGYTAPKSAAASASVFMGSEGAGFGGRLEGTLAKQAEAPETVTDLAVALMIKNPEDIAVGTYSDPAVQGLYEEAMAQNDGKKMTAYEVANLLNQLMNEPECPQADIDDFYIAYDYLILNYEMPEVEDDADLELEKPTSTIDLTESAMAEAVSLMLAD